MNSMSLAQIVNNILIFPLEIPQTHLQHKVEKLLIIFFPLLIMYFDEHLAKTVFIFSTNVWLFTKPRVYLLMFVSINVGIGGINKNSGGLCVGWQLSLHYLDMQLLAKLLGVNKLGNPYQISVLPYIQLQFQQITIFLLSMFQYFQLNAYILGILPLPDLQTGLQTKLTHNTNIPTHINEYIHQYQLLLFSNILTQTRIVDILCQLTVDMLHGYFCMELPDVVDVVRKWDHVIVNMLSNPCQGYLVYDVIVFMLGLLIDLELFGEVHDMAVCVCVKHVQFFYQGVDLRVIFSLLFVFLNKLQQLGKLQFSQDFLLLYFDITVHLFKILHTFANNVALNLSVIHPTQTTLKCAPNINQRIGMRDTYTIFLQFLHDNFAK